MNHLCELSWPRSLLLSKPDHIRDRDRPGLLLIKGKSCLFMCKNEKVKRKEWNSYYALWVETKFTTRCTDTWCHPVVWSPGVYVWESNIHAGYKHKKGADADLRHNAKTEAGEQQLGWRGSCFLRDFIVLNSLWESVFFFVLFVVLAAENRQELGTLCNRATCAAGEGSLTAIPPSWDALGLKGWRFNERWRMASRLWNQQRGEAPQVVQPQWVSYGTMLNTG